MENLLSFVKMNWQFLRTFQKRLIQMNKIKCFEYNLKSRRHDLYWWLWLYMSISQKFATCYTYISIAKENCKKCEDIIFFKISSSYHSSGTSKFANLFSLDCVESVHPFKSSANQIIFIDVLWFLLSDVEQWLLEEILHKYLPLFLFGLGSQHTFKKQCYHTDYWYYQTI